MAIRPPNSTQQIESRGELGAFHAYCRIVEHRAALSLLANGRWHGAPGINLLHSRRDGRLGAVSQKIRRRGIGQRNENAPLSLALCSS
jgi:hypothetical protein